MIRLKEILEFDGDIRNLRLEVALSDNTKLYNAIRNLRSDIYTLWDLLYRGEQFFKKYLEKDEFIFLQETLASYGLKFNDIILGKHEFFDYALLGRLDEIGFDALSECSLIDFLEGSEAMEFINKTVVKSLKSLAKVSIEHKSYKVELEEEEKYFCMYLEQYKQKVMEKRLELYNQLSPEDALELEKRRASSRINAKLHEIEHFHHKNNVTGERIHYNNPFNTDDYTL